MLSRNRTWYKPENIEFVVHVDKEHAITTNISTSDLYSSLQNWSLSQPVFCRPGDRQRIGKDQAQIRKREMNPMYGALSGRPLNRDSVVYKFNVFSTIEKETNAPGISKTNQQYQMYLQFDYIGSDKFARKYIDEKVNNFKPLVPIGYTISSNNNGFYWWGQKDKKQYWLLLLIVVMIFFICSVLFDH